MKAFIASQKPTACSCLSTSMHIFAFDVTTHHIVELECAHHTVSETPCTSAGRPALVVRP